MHWTEDEEFFGRLVTGEAQFFPANIEQQFPVFRIKADHLADMAVSPGPSKMIAVFIRETAGSPAAVRIYPFNMKDDHPIAQKSFFKADRCKLSWSPTGRHLLALATCEVDQSGKSYYEGESKIYFLAAADGGGSFDCRVPLDREGPIHDWSWRPDGQEFTLIYGYMPKSKAKIFNLSCETIFDFPTGSSMNHVRYNPQGSLICLGGFGNLPGKVEVWSRLGGIAQVGSFQATSATICEWAPSGANILTATLTPRMRVDNGLGLWDWQGHQSSPLLHLPLPELYQAVWQTHPPVPKIPGLKAAKPTPLPSATPKPAYRPPGLRETASPVEPPVVKPPQISKEERALRKVQEKLEAIRDLKAKLASGVTLELNQLEKIKKEKLLLEELETVKANCTNKQ